MDLQRSDKFGYRSERPFSVSAAEHVIWRLGQLRVQRHPQLRRRWHSVGRQLGRGSEHRHILCRNSSAISRYQRDIQTRTWPVGQLRSRSRLQDWQDHLGVQDHPARPMGLGLQLGRDTRERNHKRTDPEGRIQRMQEWRPLRT